MAKSPLYAGPSLRHVAMPLGGIGTGQLAIAGDGGLRQWQIFNAINHLASLPDSFFAIRVARPEPPLDELRILQSRELLDQPAEPTPLVNDDVVPEHQRALLRRIPGVQRTRFRGPYPIASLEYEDEALPLTIAMTALSPLAPLDPAASSLPAVRFRFRLTNPGSHEVKGSLGAALQNAVGWDGLTAIQGTSSPLYGGNVNRVRCTGTRTDIVLENPSLPDEHPGAGQMLLSALTANALPYERWTDAEHFANFLRGDQVGRQPHRSAREYLRKRQHGNVMAVGQGPSPQGQTWNAGLAVTFDLRPGQSADIEFVIAWHFPNRYVNFDQYKFERRDYGKTRFWLGNAYSERFVDALGVVDHLEANLGDLERWTQEWAGQFEESSLPAWLSEAMAAQAAFIRSPTCFQTADGKFYGFEGSLGLSTGMWTGIYGGSCPLNCTHVWNYEQALSRLFPSLERTVRETEFDHVQALEGYLPHRTVLPLYLGQFWGEEIGGPRNPALDGMLSTVLKTYREVRQSGDREWLRRFWPSVHRLLEHCTGKWDPDGDGVLEGEQPNTFDIAFYGTEPFHGTLWLAALRAGEEMARLVGEDGYADQLRERFERGRRGYDEALWNGEYYEQRLSEIERCEPFQYGAGCLSDQLIGQWWAHQLELGHLLPAEHVRTALRSIVRHNFQSTFQGFDHGYRVFADQDDAGLLICTWPRGGRPEVPVRYADEVWTGSEYQVAALCLMEGLHEEGLRILEALRGRYDGRRRNPYNEIECGDHYARAMAGWSVLEGLSGLRYDGLAQRVTIADGATPGRYPFVAGSAWGTLEVAGDRITIRPVWGDLAVRGLTVAGRQVRGAAVNGEAVVDIALDGARLGFREGFRIQPGQAVVVQVSD